MYTTPDRSMDKHTKRNTIIITKEEAEYGCFKQAAVGNSLFSFNVPKGSKTGDVIQIASKNGDVVCVIEIKVEGTNNDEQARPKKKKSLITITCLLIGLVFVSGLLFYLSSGRYVKHTYEGISFLLPDDWVDDEEWNKKHQINKYYPSDWRMVFLPMEDGALLHAERIDEENLYYGSLYEKILESGLEGIYDYYDYMTEENGYSVLNHGYVVIDGVNCYEYEYVYRYDDAEYDYSGETMCYELYIPCKDSNCIIMFEFDDEIGGGTYDRSEYKDNEHFEKFKRIR